MKRKIKILHLINSMGNGGAQRVVLNYLKDLTNDSDIEVKLLVYNDKSDSYCNNVIEKEHYNVDYLHKNVHSRFLRKIFKILIGKIRLKKYIKKYNPDIIHTHDSPFLTGCLLPIEKCNVPLKFHTLHSNPYRYNGKQLEIIKKAFQKDNFVAICVTNEQVTQAKDHYGIENYEVVHNGIDIDKIKKEMVPKEDARAVFDIEKDAFVIGTVGRLNKIKKYDMLIKVFKRVYDKNPKALLIIAGEGAEKDYLVDLAKKLNIDKSVRFLGNIDNTTEFYCSIDVFALTSDTESSSLVLLESQICGKRGVISNGVPSESIITNHIKKMSATATLDDWANALLDVEFKGSHRFNSNDYEVHNMSKLMKQIYIKYWNEYNKKN